MRLRNALPSIEAAKAAGVRHQDIVDVLNQHGLAISLKSFEMMLYRLRQERGSAAATRRQ